MTILCDTGAKYQSRLFNRKWLAEKGLLEAAGIDQPLAPELVPPVPFTEILLVSIDRLMHNDSALKFERLRHPHRRRRSSAPGRAGCSRCSSWACSV